MLHQRLGVGRHEVDFIAKVDLCVQVHIRLLDHPIAGNVALHSCKREREGDGESVGACERGVEEE